MKKPLIVLLLTFIAAVGMTGAASAQLIDLNLSGLNSTNLAGFDPLSILNPEQLQAEAQAQLQAQASKNDNDNNLTNANVNVAVSTSNATNTNTITNNNTFNPTIVVQNTNAIGNITVSSTNINAQRQVAIRRW